jgi:hypothetical protein
LEGYFENLIMFFRHVCGKTTGRAINKNSFPNVKGKTILAYLFSCSSKKGSSTKITEELLIITGFSPTPRRQGC